MALTEDQKAEKALLKEINKASTIDDVNALLPETDPSAVVVDAINARIAVLEITDVDPDELVTYEKDGETIQVHPTQIGPWEAQGWTVAE